MKKTMGQSYSTERPPTLLTIKQVAERLTVSVGCLRAWRIRGYGPPAIRIGSALRWDEREVDAWLDARRESGGGAIAVTALSALGFGSTEQGAPATRLTL